MIARRQSSLCLISLLVPAVVLFGACGAPPPPVAPSPAAPPPAAAAPRGERAAPATTPQESPAPPPPAQPPTAAAAPAAPPPNATPAQTSEAPKPAAVAEKTGEAVYYDPQGRGACSLTFNKQAGVASVPNVIYKNIEACGQCIEVSGPAGSTVIMVVDRCNNCADNMMVISKPAFDKIAGESSKGREEIRWKPARCDVQGNIELRIKKTSSAYWTAIQARNHTWAVKSMAFKRDGQWVEMTRSNDNYFVAEKGVGKGPLALRITATDGQTVEHTFETWKDGETYQSPVQFK